MRLFKRFMVAFFALPVIICAGLFAVIKIVYSLTFEMAYDIGNKWHMQMLLRINDFMQSVKDPKKH